MIKKINKFDHVMIVGRVGNLVKREDGSVRIALVENFSRNNEDPKWINLYAFRREAERLLQLEELGALKGAVLALTARVVEKEDRIFYDVNSFSVAKFPRRKETETEEE